MSFFFFTENASRAPASEYYVDNMARPLSVRINWVPPHVESDPVQYTISWYGDSKQLQTNTRQDLCLWRNYNKEVRTYSNQEW